MIEGQCYFNIYLADVFFRQIDVTPGDYRRMRELLEDMHRSQRAQVPLQSDKPLMVQFSLDVGNEKSV